MIRFAFVSSIVCWGSALLFASATAGDLDRMEKPPAGWNGRVFAPSYEFPSVLPAQEPLPWAQIDFRNDPKSYLAAVLGYVLAGQDIQAWRVQDNPVRRWYHAPWMGPGAHGREFISGLTRGRNSQPRELGPNQTRCRQNWAVVVYNPTGGYVLGRIWEPVIKNTGPPGLSALPFPVGTVAVKFQFTEATEQEVDLLRGAPIWQANVHVRTSPSDTSCPQSGLRAPVDLRLLQVDVAVRDERAEAPTGWVFGSYVYDGRKSGSDPWKKLDPIGLTWGNDPDLTDAAAAQGAKPRESIVLSDFGLKRAFGRGGRMNGPIDTAQSACLSCHMTSQWPNPAQLNPPAALSWELARCWFRNLDPTTPFGLAPAAQTPCGSLPTGSKLKALDMSFQLAIGLRNWTQETQPPARVVRSPTAGPKRPREFEPFRVDGLDSRPISREGEQ